MWRITVPSTCLSWSSGMDWTSRSRLLTEHRHQEPHHDPQEDSRGRNHPLSMFLLLLLVKILLLEITDDSIQDLFPAALEGEETSHRKKAQLQGEWGAFVPSQITAAAGKPTEESPANPV